MKQTKIYLADDHTVVREAIKTLLSFYPEFLICGEASGWHELEPLIRNKVPDLIILDIEMPGLNGLEISELLQHSYPQIRKIILSAHVDSETIYQAVNAGVLSILPKNSTEDELSTAIHKAIEGEEYYTHHVAQMLIKNYINKNTIGSTYTAKPNIQLSDREIEIITGFSDGLSYKEIGAKLEISPRTVESHKLNIMDKLGLHTIIDIVKFAIKNNIISI
jgi:DNA-binding NarL/FixJ family response regulator